MPGVVPPPKSRHACTRMFHISGFDQLNYENSPHLVLYGAHEDNSKVWYTTPPLFRLKDEDRLVASQVYAMPFWSLDTWCCRSIFCRCSHSRSPNPGETQLLKSQEMGFVRGVYEHGGFPCLFGCRLVVVYSRYSTVYTRSVCANGVYIVGRRVSSLSAVHRYFYIALRFVFLAYHTSTKW